MTIHRSSKIIFFFGSQGVFSASVFSQILQQGITISRVFCAGIAPASVPERTLPVARPAKEITIESLARDHGIPVVYIPNQPVLNSIKPDGVEYPDYILVACFPYRLTESIIAWPPSGCLNIHPSLLPQYRGPDPIFWQLYRNETQTGVSLHFVSSELDSGPIVDQHLSPFKEGSNRHDIERSLAKSGATLFTSFLTANSGHDITGSRQDESLASYYPLPSSDKYEVSSSWSARHAYNFIRGTHSPAGNYVIKSENQSLNITSALEYSDNNNIPDNTVKLKNERFIQFSPGILRVTIE